VTENGTFQSTGKLDLENRPALADAASFHTGKSNRRSTSEILPSTGN